MPTAPHDAPQCVSSSRDREGRGVEDNGENRRAEGPICAELAIGLARCLPCKPVLCFSQNSAGWNASGDGPVTGAAFVCRSGIWPGRADCAAQRVLIATRVLTRGDSRAEPGAARRGRGDWRSDWRQAAASALGRRIGYNRRGRRSRFCSAVAFCRSRLSGRPLP